MTYKQERWAARKKFVLSVLYQARVGIIFLVFSLVVFLIGSVLNIGWQTSVSDKMAQVNDLATQVSKVRAKAAAMEESSVYSSSSVDTVQQAADDQIFSNFLNTYGTWNSLNELKESNASLYEENPNIGDLSTLVAPGLDSYSTVRGPMSASLSDDSVVTQQLSLKHSYVQQVSFSGYSYCSIVHCKRTLDDQVWDTDVLVFYTVNSDDTISSSLNWVLVAG